MLSSEPCPRQDSNLRSRLRWAVLYPLRYGGNDGTLAHVGWRGGGGRLLPQGARGRVMQTDAG